MENHELVTKELLNRFIGTQVEAEDSGWIEGKVKELMLRFGEYLLDELL